MSHDCLKRVNEQLAARNTRVELAFSLDNTERELIPLLTVKVDEKVRGRPVRVFATFCPFCGQKLKGAS